MTPSVRKIVCIAAFFSTFAFPGAKSEAASMTFGNAPITAALVRDASASNPLPSTISSSTVRVFAASDADTNTVTVTFEIKDCHTVMGQNVYVIGNAAQLGTWQVDKAFALVIQGSGADVPWKGTIKLPANTSLQYKYILWDGKTVTWEGSQKTPSGNREVTTPSSGSVHYDDGSFLVTPTK